MIETIWRKDFQNSVEKTARAKGNYQDMETAKNVQRSRSLFGQFKVESKGYSPDMSCKAKANSADEVRGIALSSSALLTAIEEGERTKNGSFQSLFNSSEACRQPEVNVVRWKLFSAAVVTKETINSQQFSRPAA